MNTTFLKTLLLASVWISFAVVRAEDTDVVVAEDVDPEVVAEDVSESGETDEMSMPMFASASASHDSVPRFIYSVGGSGSISHMMNIRMRDEKLGKKLWAGNYAIFMNSQANPLDPNISVYDRVFGFPTLEAGFQFMDYSHIKLHTEDTPYMSSPGYIWAGYVAFRRDIYRNRTWSFGYALENGISLCSRPYDPATNIDNDLIGQHLSLYFGFGLYAGYRVMPQMELSFGVEYKHNSNGATSRPNKGLNAFGMALRARYDLNRPADDKGLTYRERLRRLKEIETPAFEPFMFFDINGTVGFRTMYEEWLLHRDYMTEEDRSRGKNLGLHTVWSTSFTPMFRYNRVHATGLGLEYAFAGYLARSPLIEKMCGVEENYKHSKHTLYIAVQHEVYYKSLSLAMSVGTYLFRRHGWVGDFYEPSLVETIGIRYYPQFFKPFYLGYNVRANLGKAYSMEVKAGMHVGHWSLKKKKK
ncbi:MAG: acyloxyacyl hydrolase [Bacteroidaceae bacterium]|nr:acyloxyacyl hydrolase [Bacteroidaceae bacterium]